MTERIVIDPQSGLAIRGVDPVNYFTDGSPRYGEPDYEFSYRGAVWRFANEGNMRAFAADPDVYMPRYGGYDPVAVAQGKPVSGDPLFWIVRDQRLYLFYDERSRERFVANPDLTVGEAERRWPDVEHALSP